MKLNFGARLPVSGPLASPEGILRVAREADTLGFNAVTIHDHVSHSHHERYHNSGGLAELVDERDRQGLPVTNFYEGIVTLATVAGVTERVRMVPCAFVLPWRHPVLFAKQCVTLHELSGGRLVCCVCIGNIETDFKAMDVPYKVRGRLMNEHLEAVTRVFSPEKFVGFQGKHVGFPELEFFPKPKNLPLWIAGFFGEPAFARVAKYADGFVPGGGIGAYREGMPKLREYLKQKGRGDAELEIGTQTFMCLSREGEEAQKLARYTVESFFAGREFEADRDRWVTQALNSALVGSPDDVIRRLEEWGAVGVRFFDIRMVHRSIEDVAGMMKFFAKEVMPSFI